MSATAVHPDVQRILDAHKDVISTDPVLMIDILEMQKARNKGFPKWMYHKELPAVQVTNREQQQAVSREFGFVEYYVPQAFPAYMYRRNMDRKFEDADLNSGRCGDFVEARLVKSLAELEALEKERKPKTAVGEWFAAVTDLPPVEDGPSEDPKVTIARLQGELKAKNEAVEGKKKAS